MRDKNHKYVEKRVWIKISLLAPLLWFIFRYLWQKLITLLCDVRKPQNMYLIVFMGAGFQTEAYDVERGCIFFRKSAL